MRSPGSPIPAAAPSAGANLVPCSLELGGKSAFIVLEDADIDNAITNICRCGTFQQVRAAIHAAAKA